MRKDKIKAFELRRQQKSYAEISAQLGIPKSTLAVWFKKEDWSKEIRDRLGKEVSFAQPKKRDATIKANKARWSKTLASFRTAAEEEFTVLKKDPLFMAGLMLYWGEGDQNANPKVKLSNSDPQLIKLFYSFLKKSLRVPESKIRAHLLLYPDLPSPMMRSFWNKATGIPEDRFWNSITLKSGSAKRRISYGVCVVTINSREIKEKLKAWINLAQIELA